MVCQTCFILLELLLPPKSWDFSDLSTSIHDIALGKGQSPSHTKPYVLATNFVFPSPVLGADLKAWTIERTRMSWNCLIRKILWLYTQPMTTGGFEVEGIYNEGPQPRSQTCPTWGLFLGSQKQAFLASWLWALIVFRCYHCRLSWGALGFPTYIPENLGDDRSWFVLGIARSLNSFGARLWDTNFRRRFFGTFSPSCFNFVSTEWSYDRVMICPRGFAKVRSHWSFQVLGDWWKEFIQADCHDTGWLHEGCESLDLR